MEKIPFASLPEDKFDNPMGISSGSGAIFGASGGVMESALRTGKPPAVLHHFLKSKLGSARCD